MNGLATVLTVVFLVTFLALLAEFLYVLWRQRVFRRRSGTELPGEPFHNMTPSKEQLLYFFCLKNQCRIEPAGSSAPHPPAQGPETVVVVDDDDAVKWPHGMYGPSRVLFTIKEEDREGTETTSEPESDHHHHHNQVKTKPVRLEEKGESESLSAVVETVEDADFEETPFSTPCASPPYYTPSPSPTHDKYFPGNDGEVIVTSKVENDMLLSVSLEV